MNKYGKLFRRLQYQDAQAWFRVQGWGSRVEDLWSLWFRA